MRLSNSALTASRSSSSRARDGMVAVCVELLFYRAVLCSAVQPQQMPPSVHLRRACPDVLVRQQSQLQSKNQSQSQSPKRRFLAPRPLAGRGATSEFRIQKRENKRGAPCHLPIRVIRNGILIKYNKIKDTSKLSSPGTVTSPQQLQKRLNGNTVNVHGRTTRVHSHTGSLGHLGTQPRPMACLFLRPMRNRSIHIALS